MLMASCGCPFSKHLKEVMPGNFISILFADILFAFEEFLWMDFYGFHFI
jgi:hypothetical protein